MNLFELFVKVGVDDQASGKLSKLSSSLGKGLATAAKIGTAAVGAAAAGITALTKAAVDNYAEYEQLVGGAQLMFGNAYETVSKNAQDAYKTVQMSQNEYLQQVNGFATGLKTALGGNEQAAAELADRIITAEADIIAATGNTAENVQNAFNGIMKSNFTMLDNLQIGITPTKEGFQEVIDKVNEWNKANGEATDYQMGNLADMQSALVDYIEMQGYAGYASREAANTISGSLASAKSAWTNLITGLADGNADIGTLVDNLVTTIVGDGTESNLGVLGNVMPAVETALGGVAKLIEGAAPKIIEILPGLVTRIVPSLISSATGMVKSVIKVLPDLLETVIDAIVDNAPALIEAAIGLMESLIQGIQDNYQILVDGAIDIVKQLSTGILGMLPQIIQVGISLLFSLMQGMTSMLSDEAFIQSIVNIILEIVDILTNPDMITQMLGAAATLIVALAKGLIQAIPQLIEKVPEIIDNLGKAFGDFLQPVIDIGKNIIEGIKKGISNAWNNLVSWFKGLFGDLIGIAEKILGIASPSKVFKKIGGFTAEGFGAGFEDEFAHVKDDMEDALDFDDASFGINASIRKVGAGAAGMAYGGNSFGDVYINIDGANYDDPQSLAVAVAQELQNMTDRRLAVYV